jgi:hypothetical protein
MAWAHREPSADHGLHVAAGTAAELGLEITASGDRSALSGPGFRVIVDRRGNGDVFTVSQAARGERTIEIGRALAAALGATVLVEDAPPALVAVGTQRADRPAHAALIGALETLGPTARVASLKTPPESRDAGADLVFSVGRPTWRPDDVRADLSALASALGVTSAPLDGSFARAWCQDPDNLSREVAHLSSGDDDAHVTVFAGPGARSRLGGAHDAVTGLVASGALAVETRDLWNELARSEVVAPGPEWDEVRAAAHRATTSGGLRELRALRTVARGPVVALRDPVLGTRWLSIRRCAAAECDELLTPLAGPCPSCTPLADPIGTQRQHAGVLAVGASDLVLRRLAP